MELVGVDLALHDDQRIDATDIVEALAVAVGLTADASRANVKVPAARHRDNLGLQRGSPECLTQIKAVRRAALSSCPRGHPGTNATPADGQVRFPRSQEEGMKALVCRGPGIKAVEDRPKPDQGTGAPDHAPLPLRPDPRRLRHLRSRRRHQGAEGDHCDVRVGIAAGLAGTREKMMSTSKKVCSPDARTVEMTWPFRDLPLRHSRPRRQVKPDAGPAEQRTVGPRRKGRRTTGQPLAK